MTVNLKILLACFAHTVGRVLYHLGAKPPLGADSASFDRSDCSGWVRWALDRAGYRLPDGSQTQWAWFRAQVAAGNIHQLADYMDAERYAAADPTRLFIAFESDKRSGIGHVWLGHSVNGQMMTLECCGSHGVASRLWASLAGIAAAAYVLPVDLT